MLQQLPLELLHMIGQYLSAEDADVLGQTSPDLEYRLRPLYEVYLKRDYGLNLPVLTNNIYDAKLYYSVINMRECLQTIGVEPLTAHALYCWFTTHTHIDVHFSFQGRFDDTYTFRISPMFNSLVTMLENVKNMHRERLELLDFCRRPYTLCDLQRCCVQVGMQRPHVTKVDLLRFHELLTREEILNNNVDDDDDWIDDDDDDAWMDDNDVHITTRCTYYKLLHIEEDESDARFVY